VSVILAAWFVVTNGAYVLEDYYYGSTFFDNFTFFNTTDPTECNNFSFSFPFPFVKKREREKKEKERKKEKEKKKREKKTEKRIE
jgi:hypothetical protein